MMKHKFSCLANNLLSGFCLKTFLQRRGNVLLVLAVRAGGFIDAKSVNNLTRKNKLTTFCAISVIDCQNSFSNTLINKFAIKL